MCIILFPDIIVASKLMEIKLWNPENKDYTISVADCLKKQKRLTEIGLGNVVAEVTSQQLYDFLDNTKVFEVNGIGKFKILDDELEKLNENKDDGALDNSKFSKFLKNKILIYAYSSELLRMLRIE